MSQSLTSLTEEWPGTLEKDPLGFYMPHLPLSTDLQTFTKVTVDWMKGYSQTFIVFFN